MNQNTSIDNMYKSLGVSDRVYSFCEDILKGLEERFREIDKDAEYNQLKVLRAMKEHQVSEACLLGTTG